MKKLAARILLSSSLPLSIFPFSHSYSDELDHAQHKKSRSRCNRPACSDMEKNMMLSISGIPETPIVMSKKSSDDMSPIVGIPLTLSYITKLFGNYDI